MSCLIKYDLLEKVNTANGKMNMNRVAPQELRNSFILFSLMTAGNIISKREGGINWTTNLAFFWAFYSLRKVARKNNYEKVREDKELDASLDLEKLIVELKDKLNIYTSLELMKRARIDKVENNFPKLEQNKYILVPRYLNLDDSNIEAIDTSLTNVRDIYVHQEHKLFTDKYVLSLGSPTKK